jgi:D-sedoheptulose 7-phosphate isomerase
VSETTFLPDLIYAELTEARTVLNQFLANPAQIASIAVAANLMANSLQNGG